MRGPKGWIIEYKERGDVKMDNDVSGGQEDGWESKATLPPGQLQSVLQEREAKRDDVRTRATGTKTAERH